MLDNKHTRTILKSKFYHRLFAFGRANCHRVNLNKCTGRKLFHGEASSGREAGRKILTVDFVDLGEIFNGSKQDGGFNNIVIGGPSLFQDFPHVLERLLSFGSRSTLHNFHRGRVKTNIPGNVNRTVSSFNRFAYENKCGLGAGLGAGVRSGVRSGLGASLS